MANWVERIIKRKKDVDAIRKERPGAYQQEIANQLRINKKTLFKSYNFAGALEKHPELKQCRTESEARAQLKRINSGGQEKRPRFRIEEDLRNFLRDNWQNTPLSKEWDLEECGYPAKMSGKTERAGRSDEIDALARHKRGEGWLVMELKLLRSSDEAVGQLLRYMGWVKYNLAGQDEIVKGLLIADEIDETTLSALYFTKHIEAKEYRVENDQLFLEDYDKKKIIIGIFSPEKVDKLHQYLQEQRERI